MFFASALLMLLGCQKEQPHQAEARTDFPNREYVQGKRYKLYASGEFYDFVADPLEESPKKPEDLGKEAKLQYQALQQVLAGMRK